ncbi:hypothetical protein JMUB7504_27150 [Staphylococcus aureus]
MDANKEKIATKRVKTVLTLRKVTTIKPAISRYKKKRIIIKYVSKRLSKRE